MKSIRLPCLGLLIAGLMPIGQVTAVDLADYTVEQLLEPCVEGDNDARWGAAAEAECEQYIMGFSDAYLLFSDGGKRDGVCLPPPGNRPDEIRWKFVKWVHRNLEHRSIPAGEGLLETLKSEFKCSS